MSNIPAEMKNKDQWVLYRIEDGKKMPVNARTFRNASSTDAATWSPYEVAISAAGQRGTSGIGFVFNNDYVGIDLDDCIGADNKIKQWGIDILKTLDYTYMEKSISGRGIHAICKGVELPGKGLNVRFKEQGLFDGVGGIEMYQNGRYFITTGNTVSPKTTEIKSCDEAVISLYTRFKTSTDRFAERDRKSALRGTNFDAYETIRSNVTMEQVVTHYGISIDRDQTICCPFHNEKNPSLRLYEHDFYCYGCRKYGDAVTFIMHMEGCDNNYQAAQIANSLFHVGLDMGDGRDRPRAVQTRLPARPDPPQPSSQTAVESIVSRAINLSDVKPYDGTKEELVRSSISSLNRYVNGFCMGKTTVWTGISSGGKSTVLGQEIVAAIEQGYKVFAFSGELMASNFQHWIDLQAAGIGNTQLIRNPTSNMEFYVTKDEVRDKIHRWYDKKIFLYDNKSGVGITTLLETMKVFVTEVGCRVFVIDNLMRLDLEAKGDKYDAQGSFIKKVLAFSQEYNVHVHLVAHPKKVIGSIITMMDISGSGDIVNNADNIIAIHKVTDKFREEMRVNVTGNVKPGKSPVLEKMLESSNIVEVFKCRATGISDTMIPCEYSEESKRITDKMFPEDRFRQYSWSKE